jgi:exodeoxyribonuclease VII large subunit
VTLLQRGQNLREWQRRLHERALFRLRQLQSAFATAEARLRLLGPENVLARGYSITLDGASGKVVRAASEVRAGQRLRTKLKVGEIASVVEGDSKDAE